MKILNNARITFHNGNAFDEGIEKKPFAVFTYAGFVDRDLLDVICGLIRDHVNEKEGDFCNVKITAEDWDC